MQAPPWRESLNKVKKHRKSTEFRLFPKNALSGIDSKIIVEDCYISLDLKASVEFLEILSSCCRMLYLCGWAAANSCWSVLKSQELLRPVCQKSRVAQFVKDTRKINQHNINKKINIETLSIYS